MSQDMDDMHISFLNNTLPPIWRKVSYASLKPLGSWFKDMLLRFAFLRNWIDKDNPLVYWISAFFFP